MADVSSTKKLEADLDKIDAEMAPENEWKLFDKGIVKNVQENWK